MLLSAPSSCLGRRYEGREQRLLRLLREKYEPEKYPPAAKKKKKNGYTGCVHNAALPPGRGRRRASRRRPTRARLAGLRRPKQAYALHVPRVTAAELAANATLMSGHWPYILTVRRRPLPAPPAFFFDFCL